MHPEFIGIREFSQKLFQYLKENRPVVLMKHGKPFRLLRPVTVREAVSLKKSNSLDDILHHKAVGLWKKRWAQPRSSVDIIKKARRHEESRYLK